MTTITLPAHLDSLTRGLALVVACATAEGFPSQRVTEIELAVEEALANICLYAYPDSNGEVVIRCARDETQHFLIEFIDTGVPCDILARPAPDITVDTAQRQVGGLGIPLIRALMDNVTYQREGARNILRLAARLPREGAGCSLCQHGGTMRIRFWGTRGSIPVALTGAGVRHKIKQALLQANGRRFDSDEAVERFIDAELDFPTRHSYGGNSACVDIVGGTEYMVCDMGSGLRSLGQQIMREHGPGTPQVYNFFMSHVHWDHIMGFPFFPPAYIPGNTIRIHGCHALSVMQEAFHRQQSDPCFPVHWENLGADITLVHLEPGQWYEMNGFRVKAKLQPHHGDSYGYRFEKDGKVVVYSTDGEHKLESEEATNAMIDFYRDADLVIFDAMYSLADMITIKEDWGHSSNVVGVDLCLHANVKHYCMFHHEPAYDDATIHSVLQETVRYEEIMREGTPLQVSTAYDGLVIHV